MKYKENTSAAALPNSVVTFKTPGRGGGGLYVLQSGSPKFKLQMLEVAL